MNESNVLLLLKETPNHSSTVTICRWIMGTLPFEETFTGHLLDVGLVVKI